MIGLLGCVTVFFLASTPEFWSNAIEIFEIKEVSNAKELFLVVSGPADTSTSSATVIELKIEK